MSQNKTKNEKEGTWKQKGKGKKPKEEQREEKNTQAILGWILEGGGPPGHLPLLHVELDDICQLISWDGLAIKNPPAPLFPDVSHGVHHFS
jgi:hypothetical protein